MTAHQLLPKKQTSKKKYRIQAIFIDELAVKFILHNFVVILYMCESGGWGWELTHWGRLTHVCVNKLTIIGSDNGLSPGRRQAIIWTNAGILLIGPLGKNFSEILIKI